ncbi:MAG: bacteriocin [bacterium]|nr:bacteriocin [bacterium]
MSDDELSKVTGGDS